MPAVANTPATTANTVIVAKRLVTILLIDLSYESEALATTFPAFQTLEPRAGLTTATARPTAPPTTSRP